MLLTSLVQVSESISGSVVPLAMFHFCFVILHCTMGIRVLKKTIFPQILIENVPNFVWSSLNGLRTIWHLGPIFAFSFEDTNSPNSTSCKHFMFVLLVGQDLLLWMNGERSFPLSLRTQQALIKGTLFSFVDCGKQSPYKRNANRVISPWQNRHGHFVDTSTIFSSKFDTKKHTTAGFLTQKISKTP